jgi:putative transposase
MTPAGERTDCSFNVLPLAGFSEPGYNACMKPTPHRHLKRLDHVWVSAPVYFVTTCTRRRARLLDNPAAHAICVESWETGRRHHGWHVGRYMVMPDHVHFFCVPEPDAKPLAVFVGKWKEWTAKFLHRRCGVEMPLWQEEFFDHLLRSQESHAQKWDYVRENPVRARLALQSDDWPHQGCLTDLRIEDVETL